MDSQTYRNTAAKAVDQEDKDFFVAMKRGDEECAKYINDLTDKEACYKRVFQMAFVSKAVYPEMARTFIDNLMYAMTMIWTGRTTPEQLNYITARLRTEYTLARNNAVYARMDSMMARESASSSRWAEIAAGAATSIGTAAALSQPQFVDPPPLIKQPYWSYSQPYQDPRRDEYHMHPGVKW